MTLHTNTGATGRRTLSLNFGARASAAPRAAQAALPCDIRAFRKLVADMVD